MDSTDLRQESELIESSKTSDDSSASPVNPRNLRRSMFWFTFVMDLGYLKLGQKLKNGAQRDFLTLTATGRHGE